MKKLAALVLALVLAMGMMACTNPAKPTEPTKATVDIGIDMSGYPTDLESWTDQNFIDYFTAAGVFRNDNGAETWSQDHENYWYDTPVSYCAGWWTDDGSAMVMIMKLGVHADADEAMNKHWIDTIKEKKALPDDYAQFTVDHLIGNVVFIYGDFTMDDEVFEKMNKAYDDLVKVLDLKPEF